ncbi:cold-shock protein [Streptomyces sp. NPDC059917]|uniref:cold-shock protein n=1 Tax=Streptomyces sp. NPDC059917 TaxID=3347002 RepID=UPI00364BAE2D
MVVSGRVIRFDGTRGYGFIAPEDGGEDVFLHVNDMLIPESYVRSGTALEFEVEDGDRGLKASSVRLATNPDGTPVTPPVAAAAATGAASGRTASGDDALCDALSRGQYLREVTEVLLESVPTLTGAQIVQVRNRFLQVAQGHGWIEG